MESLHCKTKRNPLTEETKKEKRENDRNRFKTRVSRWAFTQWKACQYCVSLYHWDPRWLKTNDVSTSSVSKTSCLCINTTRCFPQPCQSNEIGVSRSNWDSCGCSLLWTVASLLAVAVLLMLCLRQQQQQ